MSRIVQLMTILTMGSVLCRPKRVTNMDTAWEYMANYNYVGESSMDPEMVRMSRENKEEAARRGIMDFQHMAGLNMTGKLDDDTMMMMNMPRCGNKDKTSRRSSTRRRRYNLYGVKWRYPSLTYRIIGYSSDLDRATIDREIERAKKVWEDESAIRITKKDTGRVSIEVDFRVGDHGDNSPFDGPSGTLAHAFFPPYGDMHMDDDELFTSETTRGVNLLQVAAHEFGHSLGMEHSSSADALMAPFYRGFQPEVKLSNDDIMGIRALYGPPPQEATTRTTTTTTTTTPSPAPTSPSQPSTAVLDSLCSGDVSFDAITVYAHRTEGMHLYGFVGSRVLRLPSSGDVTDQALSSSVFNTPDNRGPTTGVDAAVLRRMVVIDGIIRTNITYLFKGSQCWAYDEDGLMPRFPVSIADQFPGVPSDIDAALSFSSNGQLYFFKGSQYYKYDDVVGVTPFYPRSIDLYWPGIPDSPHSAIEFGFNMTYFIMGRNIYHFDTMSYTVTTGFPRPLKDWLPCPVRRQFFPKVGEDGFVDVESMDGVSGQDKLAGSLLFAIVLAFQTFTVLK